eukprot:750502-Hanusia_phi.AAC.2
MEMLRFASTDEGLILKQDCFLQKVEMLETGSLRHRSAVASEHERTRPDLFPGDHPQRQQRSSRSVSSGARSTPVA